MRTRSTVKVMNTVCGKTISFLQTDGHPNKMHSVEGPAVIYPEMDNKSPEYYLYGIKYSKADWKERLSQRKTMLTTEIAFDSQY